MVDAEQLATVVEDFCATMTQEFSVDDILAKLADSVVRVLGVDGAGIMTADRDTAQEAQQQLAHRAMHDVLTGLPVRWVFLEHLTRALARLDRARGQAAVLFLDLDGLKYVNDRHGHAAGDRLLIECVAR